jgi:ribosomal protein L29
MADKKAEAPAAGDAAAKRQKINSLTLAELEAKLAACREKQGSLRSKYAQQLLARKKALSS